MTGGGKARWPAAAPSFRDAPPARVEGARLRLSYIGHASFLIQTHGVNLLIDPVFARRASPLRFAGPKRVNPPGIAEADLPALDAVLVTHNHYDHMDVAALARLARSRPCRVVTPLGNDAILRRADRRIAAEALDWGARVEIAPGVAVWLEPTLHWSARGLGDRRMALWCAFVVETPAGRVYCVGDTAFGDGALFEEMRQKHGGFRLALLPIGAYAPRWFMAGQHVDPDEAVRAFRACGAQEAFAHHWGTFQLTDEAIDAPPQALAQALAAHGVEAARFHVKRPGETLELDF
jgi:L-ascorbate metabolism protein UlaG (beta-lactamase superfamily)